MAVIAGFFLLWPEFSRLETELFISADMINLPEGLALTSSSARGIHVRIDGPKSSVSTLLDSNLKTSLDLSHAAIGINTIPVTLDDLTLPEGISITRVFPTSVTVRLDKQTSRQIPIEIRLSGKPAAGFHVTETVAIPSSVLLRGPEKLMGSIEKILSEPIDVDGLSESFKKETALNIPEGLHTDSSKIIMAEIVMNQKIGIKHFYNIRIEGKNSSYGYRITPTAVSLGIRGPVNILEHLDIECDIQVFVDLGGLSPGIYVRPASIILPVDTTLASVTPEIFTIQLTKPR